MESQQLIPHLFRTESTRITAVLCKRFGIENIDVAEDIVSDTFLSALQTWPYNGVPSNPTAWLYAAAKNKALNYIQRERTFTERIAPQLSQSAKEIEETEIDLSEKNITDSQLQMLFAICHPSLSVEAQVGLALRILCGFGIDEIASAFLTNKDTINKRLYRAKETLREANSKIEFPGKEEIDKRLETVITTLYLLFSEGYYSESNDAVLREDLCLEAMRLTYLLIENEATHQPSISALFSLMCFHASRFAARKNERGEMILYEDQDENLWNKELIAKGVYHLHEASHQQELSKYHIEAAIAYLYTDKKDTIEKWDSILQLYNHLLQISYSPVAALNRTYALSKVKGKMEAIREAEKLGLISNHYYYTLLGELYKDIDNSKAKENLQKAFSLAKTIADKQIIQKKIEALL